VAAELNSYRPEDYARDCQYEADCLALLIRVCRRRWLDPAGIEDQVISRMIEERAWRRRN